MLALFTDFGLQGPYVGLLKLALAKYAPQQQVIDLFHDVPPYDAQWAAYLLAAYIEEFSEKTVFLGVVDPGVGGKRAALMLQADKQWFVGPDNGLFNQVAVRARQVEAWHITWQPKRLSASFHGRDLFAPVAAVLATETASPDTLGVRTSFPFQPWPDDLARIVYVDRYGNAMTGIRASSVEVNAAIHIAGRRLVRAKTFAEVAPGQCFWYENSSGLVELAVNQGSAAAQLGLKPGYGLQIEGETFTRVGV
jgi:S-adenosylmethionine hydrolase